MNPERWRSLSHLFREALDQPLADRARFLDEACRGDSALRAEVTSLLTYYREYEAGGGAGSAAAGTPRDERTPESLLGSALNHYRVIRKLGEGGMGVVYLGEDTRLGRRVALKALAPQYTQDAMRRERLRREARAVAGLTHPNIATVYALEEFEGGCVIVSEYVAGHTLRDEVSGPMPLEPIIGTALEIVNALAFAHEQGVVHRDLKPENVMRTVGQSIKVLDFGLAQVRRLEDLSGPRLTDTGAVMGTPGYMPPEQLRGLETDFRADQFSFGVMLYELACGVHPFAASSVASTIARVLEAQPKSLSQLNPSCPPAFDEVIVRCLEKEPARRFESTRELVRAFDQIRRDLPDTQSPRRSSSRSNDSREPRAPTSARWWWQFHQVAIGVLYYLTLLPLWFIRGWARQPWGSVMFLSAVVAVGVATTLRFHFLFASHYNAAELPSLRDRSFFWNRTADWVYVATLVAGGVLALNQHPSLTALLVAVAVSCVVGFQIIEPATARAAFKRQRSGGGRARRRPSAQSRPEAGSH